MVYIYRIDCRFVHTVPNKSERSIIIQSDQSSNKGVGRYPYNCHSVDNFHQKDEEMDSV